MIKIIIVLFLVNISSIANSSVIPDNLCVNKYIDKKIILAFNDGDIHQIVFDQNEFGIVTAKYGEFNGKVFYQNMEVNCLIDVYHPISYEILLYKNRESEAGPFINYVVVLLPWEIVSGESRAKVDLRWDFYYSPTIHIRDLSEEVLGDNL